MSDMDMLSACDLSLRQINTIMRLSKELSSPGSPGRKAPGRKGAFVLLFQKPSIRTRLSLETAAAELGYLPIYIDAETTHLSRGESIADTSHVMGLYAKMVAARLHSQDDLSTMAEASEVPVINALTETEHPCQALSDLYTILEAKRRLAGLKLAFVGDVAANTANSLMVLCAKAHIDISLVYPKGYAPNRHYLDIASSYGNVELHHSVREGVNDADVVYVDTFVSMGQEATARSRLRLFAGYQVNARLMSHAKRNAILMHCLPAHRGEEITADVIDGSQSVVWRQARNKLLVEKAIITFIERESAKA